MTEPESGPITELEIVHMRHNLTLLRNQLKMQRMDEAFVNRQLDRLDDMLKRLVKEQEQRSDTGRFEALYNVSRFLGSSLDLQVVLDQAMDAIIQLTGADRGFLMLTDDDGNITVEAARNFDQQTLSSDEFKFSRTVTNYVLDTETPVLTTNATEDPRFSEGASIIAQALRSVMATPLRARGDVIGVVYVDSRAMEELFSDEDLAALDAFSTQAAIAIDNARLFSATDEALSKRVDELRQLRRIDLQLNQTLDPDQAMAHTLEWACRLAEATGGYLGLVEGGYVRCIHRYGEAENEPRIDYLDAMYPQVADVIGNGRSVIFDWAGQTSHTALITPILRERDSVGIVILKRGDGQHFSDEQRDLVERVVARAAISIENARLYAAVRAADKAKSEFVGIVAHDLKSPMHGIKGYAQFMLMLGDLPESQVEYVEKISNTVERMEVLVSDLADISRIESGHFFMEEMRVPVAEVIKTLKDGTLLEIEARHHTFIEQIEDDLPDVWVDYFRLVQVLTNLVSNAYKYTPDGGAITLCARLRNGRVEFCIEDTGVGLSEDAVKMLGTKFWRADDKFTRSQPGSGLGFSITRSLVEQMGSRIVIESEPGKGSKFTFSVAVAPETEE